MSKTISVLQLRAILAALKLGSKPTQEQCEEIINGLENAGSLKGNDRDKKRLYHMVHIANIMYHNGEEIVPDQVFDRAHDHYLECGFEPVIGGEAIVLSDESVEITDTGEAAAKTKEEKESKKQYDKELKNMMSTTDKSYKIYAKDGERSLEKKFLPKIETKNKEKAVAASHKYDGISIAAKPNKEGKIQAARTRGNKNTYLDVTDIFEGYQILKADGTPFDMDVPMKFEAIFTKENFKKYKELMGKDLKTMRGSIAGFFTNKESKQHVDLITLVPLDIDVDLPRVQKIKVIQALANAPEFTIIKGTDEEILEKANKYAQELLEKRPTLDYQIDGVVFESLDEDVREKTKKGSWTREYEMAYKFPASEAKTVLTGVRWTVGKTGQITPMAIFDKTIIDEVEYTEATLSSENTINKLDLRIGDEIIIRRQGDVIPYVTSDDTCTKVKGDAHKVQFITHCPTCGMPLELFGEVTWTCVNPSCSSRVIHKANAMLKRLGCEGISIESIDDLQEKFKFTSLAEFMHVLMKPEEVLKEVLKEAKTKIVMKWLDEKINNYENPTPLDVFIEILSITNVGAVTARKLAVNGFDPTDVYACNQATYKAFGHTSKTTESITRQLAERWEEIEELAGLMMITDATFDPSTKLYTVVCTGFEATDEHKEKHPEVEFAKNLTKKTDLLVFKSKTSKKYQKAITDGTTTLSFEEFEKMTADELASLIEKGKAPTEVADEATTEEDKTA